MHSKIVAIQLLILLSATANTTSIEHRNVAEGLTESHSAPLLGGGMSFTDEQPVEVKPNDLNLALRNRECSTQGEISLEKRRGGGRGGSGGGRSSGGGGGGGGGRSGTGAGGSQSNAGGRTTTGSGTSRGTAGYYGGGGAVPYTSGQLSPSGIAPVLFGISLVSLFFSGAWLYSNIYSYPYGSNISYRNETAGRDESLPVLCLCQEYSVCGCDENHNQTYIDALVVNATASANISDGVYTSKIAAVNGTKTLVINGTLANGTTADGGTEEVSGAGLLVENMGFLALVNIIAMGVLAA